MCVARGFQKSIFKKKKIIYIFPPPILVYHHIGSVCKLDQVYEEKNSHNFHLFFFCNHELE